MIPAGASSQVKHPAMNTGPTPLLCQSIRLLTRLSAHRNNEFPRNHERFNFGINRFSNSALRIHEVARALCSLPNIPTGGLHCPADYGIFYQLTFATKTTTSPTVTLDATGCETVRGLGDSRWIANSPNLWIELGQALNITHPSYATFRGLVRYTAQS